MRSLWPVLALSALFAVACGAGQVDDGPFMSPVIPGDTELARSVAECMGEEAEVRQCVIERVCTHAFGPSEEMRFHMRPSGDVPWVQVELSPAGEVSGIVFSFQDGMTQNYEDVGGYPCQRPSSDEGESVGAAEERGAAPAEDPAVADADGELLTLPAAQRRRELARAAFAEAAAGTLVFQHALWLARSSDPEDHALLAEALTTPEVVELLEDTVIDRGPRRRHEPAGHRWPLAQVLLTLGDSRAPSARDVLLRLSEDPLWLGRAADADDDPVQWLILALSSLRPPPPPALAFWRRYAQPQTATLDATALALVRNGDDAAIDLFAELLSDARSPFEVRRAWLRGFIGNLRTDTTTVRVAEGLYARRLPQRLRRALLSDLFGDCLSSLRPDTGMECPDLARAPVECAAALRRIGSAALEGALPRALRRTVSEGVEQLPYAPTEAEAPEGG